jgi:two-component system, chemotaxis family, response regulator Rcp1
VDDNPADLDLTCDTLTHADQSYRVSQVKDGEEAMDFLRGQGNHCGASVPDLVILDLNLPRKDGRAVLRDIKSDPVLRNTPVIIFSTSDARPDIGCSYELGANSYVSKPGNLHDFISAVNAIGNFWFQCASLPPRRSSE